MYGLVRARPEMIRAGYDVFGAEISCRCSASEAAGCGHRRNRLCGGTRSWPGEKRQLHGCFGCWERSVAV